MKFFSEIELPNMSEIINHFSVSFHLESIFASIGVADISYLVTSKATSVSSDKFLCAPTSDNLGFL